MKRILLVCAMLGASTFVVGGVWLWLHLLSPPFRRPLPNSTLTLVSEPQDGIGPVLSLIDNAKTSIDLVMYDLTDTEVEKALVSAQSRGVSVRVLLNKGYYGAQSSMNESAYTYLKKNNVPAHWTPPSFALTHEKLLLVDNKDALIMGFNLTPAYYATSRDFAVNDSDESDVTAIEAVFDADWLGKNDTALEATDLVWSPHSEQELVSLIKSAKHSILIYNEEMSDRAVIEALKDAASRGVSINIIMTYQSTWKSAFLELIASGVHIRAYPANAPIYIHAKMIIVDDDEAFIGSQNFSTTSLDTNRELGIFITNPSIIGSLVKTFGADWQGDSGTL